MPVAVAVSSTTNRLRTVERSRRRGGSKTNYNEDEMDFELNYAEHMLHTLRVRQEEGLLTH